MGRQCPLGGYVLYLDCLECDEKVCKKNKTTNKIVIGIDQSYADSGIAVAYNGLLAYVTESKPKSNANNTEKRKQLSEKLDAIFNKAIGKAERFGSCEVICIIERIRLQSAKPGEQHFLNINYIKGIGALNAVIVDTANKYGIKVYSVDTRSWKSRVVGTSRPANNRYGFPSEKWPTIDWCIKKGYGKYIIEEVSPKKKKCVIEECGNRYTYNDNKADAIGIAMYGFVSGQKLEEEQ